MARRSRKAKRSRGTSEGSGRATPVMVGEAEPRVRSPRALGMALVFVVVLAVAGVLLAGEGWQEWYEELVKPGWLVPLWVFLPVAALVYALGVFLLYRINTRSVVVADADGADAGGERGVELPVPGPAERGRWVPGDAAVRRDRACVVGGVVASWPAPRVVGADAVLAVGRV